MKLRYKALLEDAIEKVINKIAEDDNAIDEDLYYAESLVERMTDAATNIFDMSMEAQRFAKDQLS